ncbi:hypothetical protein SERLADRAFT_347709, partial [Serpula lacrymans var. lacrymans S7.9]
KLGSMCKMQDLGETKYFLRIEIQCDHLNKTISLLQPQYIDMVLELTGMKNCKLV